MLISRAGFPGILFRVVVTLIVLFSLSCGEGWEAYKDYYDETGPPPGVPWEGAETVLVILGTLEIETPLAGIETSEFQGVGAVRLSDLIEESGITATPENYRYDFTAADGYNLLLKRGGDLQELPSWENMQHGFLYLYQSLETGWEEHPWGSDVSAYNVKYMDGGTIELLGP